MTRRRVLLLLAILAAVLFEHLAGLPLGGRSHGGPVAAEPAQLQSADLPLKAGRDFIDSRPALKRGGHAMAVAETSRRKLRVPQRPPAQPLILTSRSAADGPRSSVCLRLSSEPPLKLAGHIRAFLATGPPVRDAA